LEAQGDHFHGKEEDLGDGLKAYVVRPSHPNRCGLISFQDIYRYDSARNKGVADQFAQAGFTVVHVDWIGENYFQGDKANLFEWVRGFPFADLKPKLSDNIIPYLKKSGVTKLAVCGYCWGCLNAFQACGDPDLRSELCAAVNFHPSLRLNEAFGGHPEANDLAERVTVPQLFVAAGNDPDFVGPEGSVMKILQRTTKSKGVVMADMRHGFVIRGDVNQEDVRQGVKASLELAIEFIKENMG
jgi:dienelactone hydrolase